MEEFLSVKVHDEFAKRIQEENDRQNKRIQKLENASEQITKLAISVEKIASSVEIMTKELEQQGARLKVIEEKPAHNWDKFVWAVVTGAIGIILGYIFTSLGIK